MKVSLVSVNAKYVHTGLAGRYLLQRGSEFSEHMVDHQEYSINQPIDVIVSELLRNPSEAYGFSCYIWNMSFIDLICKRLKQIDSNLILFLGGPEVSFEEESVLEDAPYIDFIVRGEGETVFSLLLEHRFSSNEFHLIPSLTYRCGNEILRSTMGQSTEMESLAFGYSDDDLTSPGKIFYYESSRGCPYRCAFCLSAQDGNRVRVRPLNQVFSHMDRFLEKNVKQVKFIDRTFNADPERALALISYLKEHHNGITNFHFECSPDRLTDEFISALQTLPEGMIQLEIGIQTTNKETSQAIHRAREIDRYRQVIGELRTVENIHLHVDLIAGLPFEGFASFRVSFNDVFSLRAHVIQLGFLKLLKGSELRLRNSEYGLVCAEDVPYEVLWTPWLPYRDVQRLKWIENLVDKYHNSQGFPLSLIFACEQYASPFDFFEEFSRFWVANEYHLRQHRKRDLYQRLSEFADSWQLSTAEREEWMERLVFDSLYALGEPFRKDHPATKGKKNQKNELADCFLAEEKHLEKSERKKRYPDFSIGSFTKIGSLIQENGDDSLSLVFLRKRTPLLVQPSEVYQYTEEEYDVQFNRLAIRF